MRIVIIGDYQLDNTPEEMTIMAMEDVRKTNPDLVIVMGDYGRYADLGKPETIFQCKKFLDLTGSYVHPLLGNHDFQNEIGNNILPHGTIENAVREAFGVEDTFFIYEHEQFRLFAISLDSWEEDPPISVNECYVSDQHFQWIKNKIAERPGVPIIMLTHAPIMGSGLRTVPGVHIRAANAYMDQSTDPMRWINLTEHPEIIMWLSAHYHLSHHHPDSLVERNGVVYALTGVHGGVTRDDKRQSRILDINDDKIELKTLDHIERKIIERNDFESLIPAMLDNRKSLFPKVSPPKVHNWLASFEPLGSGGIKPIGNGHVLISTKDDYLWEADPQWCVVLGTLHYKDGAVSDYCVSGNTVWRAFKNVVVGVNANSPWRFTREKWIPNHHEQRFELNDRITKLEPIINSGVRAYLANSTTIDIECPIDLR
jgi:3',5'-cyclic AMP phosphodiesterase CpdA